MRKSLAIILGLLFILVNCQKEPVNCNYIIGCANENFSVNDTISESRKESIITSRPSITIEHIFNRYMASLFSEEWARVFTEENFEILADSSLKLMFDNNDTLRKVVFSPKILNSGDIIDPDGYWTDTVLLFSYHYDYLKYDPETRPATRIYPGWNNLGKKYLAFRETGSSQNLYGWIELELIDYKIVIYRYGLQ